MPPYLDVSVIGQLSFFKKINNLWCFLSFFEKYLLFLERHLCIPFSAPSKIEWDFLYCGDQIKRLTYSKLLSHLLKKFQLLLHSRMLFNQKKLWMSWNVRSKTVLVFYYFSVATANRLMHSCKISKVDNKPPTEPEFKELLSSGIKIPSKLEWEKKLKQIVDARNFTFSEGNEKFICEKPLNCNSVQFNEYILFSLICPFLPTIQGLKKRSKS